MCKFVSYFIGKYSGMLLYYLILSLDPNFYTVYQENCTAFDRLIKRPAMQTISCPTCGEALPAAAKYCAGCGKSAPLAEATLRLHPVRAKRANPIWGAARRSFLED